MWLSGRQTPDFRTIADFRKDKLKEVKKIFTQVLELCIELGMVRVGKVSIDGTKFRADASENKIQYRKLLQKRKSQIEEKVEEILVQVEEIDKEEEKLYGNDTEHVISGLGDKDIKKKLDELNRRKQNLEKKKDKLKAKESGINIRLRKMKIDRNTMSSVDKDATLMFMKEKHIAPGYNVQFATEHQVILAYGTYRHHIQKTH